MSSFLKTCSFVTILMLFTSNSYAVTSWNKFLPQRIDKSDFESMKEKARHELTGKSVGTELSWENSETNLKGTVKLVSVFKINNHECRGVIHKVSFDNGQVIRFDGTLCKNTNDKWEVLPFTFLNDQ